MNKRKKTILATILFCLLIQFSFQTDARNLETISNPQKYLAQETLYNTSSVEKISRTAKFVEIYKISSDPDFFKNGQNSNLTPLVNTNFQNPFNQTPNIEINTPNTLNTLNTPTQSTLNFPNTPTATAPNQYSLTPNINFTEKITDNSLLTQRSPEQCKSIVLTTLNNFPAYHYSSLKSVELLYEKGANRGGANASFLRIRCNDISDSEIKAVITHELGHIVDGGMLIGQSAEQSGFIDLGKPVKMDDPSLDYYKISWKNDSEKISSAKRQDFCSNYGQTNPFEDFAECYIYYALHPDLFELKAKDSVQLRKKFEFMKDFIFSGKKIVEKSQTKNKAQVYDNTKLTHSL
jgi:hypothetical protein